MKQRYMIVTGANSGMGLATTIELAKKGYFVIMACRNQTKAEEAKKKAVEESGSSFIDVIACDLSSLESIEKFVARVKELYPVIDGLINNAGVVTIKKEHTQQGFEMMLGVNHLGHYLLTRLLLPSLQKADEARIINVSSGAYKAGNLDLDDPFFRKRSFNVAKGYAQSKLANLLFTKQLAKELEGTNVQVFSLHPGAVSTSLGVNRDTGFGQFIHRLLRPFFLTAAEGAQTAIYLASEPDLHASNGTFLYKMKAEPIKHKQLTDEHAAALWQWSEEQVQWEK